MANGNLVFNSSTMIIMCLYYISHEFMSRLACRKRPTIVKRKHIYHTTPSAARRIILHIYSSLKRRGLRCMLSDTIHWYTIRVLWALGSVPYHYYPRRHPRCKLYLPRQYTIDPYLHGYELLSRRSYHTSYDTSYAAAAIVINICWQRSWYSVLAITLLHKNNIAINSLLMHRLNCYVWWGWYRMWRVARRGR